MNSAPRRHHPSRCRALLVARCSTGCSTLPESGPVHRQAAYRPDRPQDAPYFLPPGPAKDGTPAAIVSGFLVRDAGQPVDDLGRALVPQRACTEHVEAEPRHHRLREPQGDTDDERRQGAALRHASSGLPWRLAWWHPRRIGDAGHQAGLRGGQWRIDNPVNALAVPTFFFDRSFARFNLYFYDATGRTLLPDPVFIPRGEQTATNLVRGLLAGPGSALGDIARSALPQRTDLDLSVVVTESGVAEVPLSREVLRASPSELSRVVDQLAWTLRPVPGIERVRITVGGAPVPLPGGTIDASVTSGPKLDARQGPSPPGALRGGRVVDLSSSSNRSPSPARSVGRDAHCAFAVAPADRLARCRPNGSTVFVSAADGGTARRVATGARPAAPVVRHVRRPVAPGPHRAGARVLVVDARTESRSRA